MSIFRICPAIPQLSVVLSVQSVAEVSEVTLTREVPKPLALDNTGVFDALLPYENLFYLIFRGPLVVQDSLYASRCTFRCCNVEWVGFKSLNLGHFAAFDSLVNSPSAGHTPAHRACALEAH